MDSQITIGDKYGPAMKITDQTEADAYFEVCVQHCMSFGKSREEAESIERQNLGYFAGYYDYETMDRVNRLYMTSHPIFGSSHPTATEAFNSGKELAENPLLRLAEEAVRDKSFKKKSKV